MRSVLSTTPGRVSVVLLCLLLSAFVSGQEEAIPKQVQDWQQAAAKAVQQKDLDSAMEIYGQIIQHYPQTRYAIEAHRETAIAYINAKQFEAAKARIESLKTQYADHPDIAGCLHWIAIHYSRNERWDEAIQLHRYNATANSSYEKAMWSQVEIVYDHIRRKDWAGAQAAQAEMLTRFAQQPTLSKEIWQIADRYLHAGQHEQALELCKFGLKTYPNSPWRGDYQITQTKIHLAMGDIDQANASLESFWTLHGDREDSVRLLEQVKTLYWRHGHHEASQALCERIIAAYPDDPETGTVVSDYICGRIAMGQDTETWQDVEAFWSRYQSHPNFIEMAHRIPHHYQHKSGDLGRALELNLRLLNTFPKDGNTIKPKRDVILLYLEMEGKARADTQVEDLLATYADHPLLPVTLNEVGNAYRRHGYYTDAIRLFETTLIQEPGDKEKLCAWADMAKAQIQMSMTADDPNGIEKIASKTITPEGIVEQLMTDYAHVSDLGFHVFQIGEEYYFLGEKLLRAGQRQEGEDALKTAIRIWESNTTIPDRRHAAMAAYFSGVASGYIGDIEAAFVYYQEVARHYPEYDKAWHARFMVAESAGKLALTGKIEASDAAAIQLAAYQDLMQNDPNSPVSSVVRQQVQTLSY